MKPIEVEEIMAPSCCLYIRNVFSQEKVDDFMREALNLNSVFEAGVFSQSPLMQSKNLNDKGVKDSDELWLDKYYENKRHLSDILTALDEYLWTSEMNTVYANTKCAIFELLSRTTSSFTHLIRYGDKQHYNWHRDMWSDIGFGVNTASYVFGAPDKHFSGGDFEIKAGTETRKFEFESNSMIIFPRSTFHRVTPIVMDEGYADKPYYYRYAVQNWAH